MSGEIGLLMEKLIESEIEVEKLEEVVVAAV